MDTFEEIYQAIETGEADGGAIPIENSTAGSIDANYDLLYNHFHVPDIFQMLEYTVKVGIQVNLQYKTIAKNNYGY